MDYALILSGGIGSRFWPLSRKSMPKQFLKVTATGQSCLQMTIRRIQPLVPNKNIYISTTRAYSKRILSQIKGLGIPSGNIILEPSPLNTLPAICLSTWLIYRGDPQANILVLPSDHYIKDRKKFYKVIKILKQVSGKGFFTLIGIAPIRPHTGYGYIVTGKKIGKGVFQVSRYIEKPDLTHAKKLLNVKKVYWNSGIFCFRADTLLGLVRRHNPRLYKQIIRIKSLKDLGPAWKNIKPISIDYGILEKSRGLAMVKGSFYWRDLGSWDAFCDISPKDRKNNITWANCLNLETSQTLIFSQDPKKLIATIGLKDMVIIDTPDSLLICRKDKTQEIKKLVAKLKDK